MATAPVRLPSSNSAGNNQTSPPMMGAPKPGSGTGMPFAMPATGANNPYFASTASHSLSGSTGVPTTGSGGLYDPTSSYTSGQSNIDKQLVDMYGKGVGGMLDNLLKGMSGQDSQIFKDWLASMKPVEASERAQLQSTLGAGGVSANSSVSAIANSNLEGQFNAQASGVSADLQKQEMQNTMEILMGTRGDAAKEVASSGWGVFADVMNNITGDIGNLQGGSYKSSGSNYGGVGNAEAPMGMSNSAGFAGVEAGNVPNAAPGGDFGANWSGNADQFDASIFDSAPADVTNDPFMGGF